MQSNGTRALVALAAVALVVVAFFVLEGDEEAGEGSGVNAGDTTQESTSTTAEGGGSQAKQPPEAKQEEPKPELTTIVLEDGSPRGGVAELEFDAGDEVRFAVTADTDSEIHIHGYELTEDVAAGKTVDFAFPADIDGIYEVESHTSGTQIAELRINP